MARARLGKDVDADAVKAAVATPTGVPVRVSGGARTLGPLATAD